MSGWYPQTRMLGFTWEWGPSLRMAYTSPAFTSFFLGENCWTSRDIHHGRCRLLNHYILKTGAHVYKNSSLKGTRNFGESQTLAHWQTWGWSPESTSIRPNDLEIQLSGLILGRFKFFCLASGLWKPGYLSVCLSLRLTRTLRTWMENMCAYDVLSGPFPSFDCPYRTDHRQSKLRYYRKLLGYHDTRSSQYRGIQWPIEVQMDVIFRDVRVLTHWHLDWIRITTILFKFACQGV